MTAEVRSAGYKALNVLQVLQLLLPLIDRNTMKTFNSALSSFLILLITTFIVPAYSLIDSISGTKTILHPGQNFTVTFHTSIYIQNNLQFYALFGIAPSPGYGQGSLGIPVPAVAPIPGADDKTDGGIDLYRAGLSNNGLKNFNVTLSLPSSLVTHKKKVTKYVLQTGVLGNVSGTLSVVDVAMRRLCRFFIR